MEAQRQSPAYIAFRYAYWAHSGTVLQTGRMKTGTGSATGCALACSEPPLVAVPAPFSSDTQEGRCDSDNYSRGDARRRLILQVDFYHCAGFDSGGASRHFLA